MSSPNFYDLPPDFDQYYPAHGWISHGGMRHIRLPIMRLYQPYSRSYERLMVGKRNSQWLHERTPHRTLRHLAVCLRDLHKEIRNILSIAQKDPGSDQVGKKRDLILTSQNESIERCETQLIAIFTLLRRLGDEFFCVSGPILFEHWQSAPIDMKKILPKAETGELYDFKPICDLPQLLDGLINNTEWFRRLRDGGVRDVIMHSPHTLSVSPVGTKSSEETNYSWRAVAQLNGVQKDGARISVDLISLLVECIDDLCQFMEKFYRAVDSEGAYETGDFLGLTGSDNDIVGFWPPIIGQRTVFPLID